MKVRTIVKSELGPYDPAYMNIRNAIETAGIFDVDWFAETGNEDKEHYYNEFINEFADWLETQDELVTKLNEYRNQPFDVEYYFGEYMQDNDADHSAIGDMYEAVYDWVQSEDDFANSPEYLDSMQILWTLKIMLRNFSMNNFIQKKILHTVSNLLLIWLRL